MCKAAVMRGEVKNSPGRSGRSCTTFLKLHLTEIHVTMCLDSRGSQQDLKVGFVKKIMQTYGL